MSCNYPHCMMGGGNCPYAAGCQGRSEVQYAKAEEKRLLDIAEQKARIANLEADTALKVKLKIETDLKDMGNL